jgi:chromosome segregation ATPase
MKNRIGVVILVLVSVILAIAVFSIKKDAAKRQDEDAGKIRFLSNQLVTVNGNLNEQKQVATMLEKDLQTQKTSNTDLSNNLTQVSGTLAKTETDLKAKIEEVKQRDTKIAELENQNQVLDKQASDLSMAITNLTVQIADTKQKLAASEGNKAFLEKELQRLMGEKTDLEKQFNDITVLRAQLAKLKEELSIARRIEWIRNGLFAKADQKGAQQLMQGLSAPAAQQKQPKPNYDLNVEVTADGSVRVIPPPTNSPAAK